MLKKRVVVLLSGRGSNLAALIQFCAAGTAHFSIVGVVSNKADAGGLALAKAANIPTATLSHKDFASRETFDAALRTTVQDFAPDLVVLAGFMRILTHAFVSAFEGRMINIHPSLLPAFTGLHTHQRALEAGCKFAGCTVHFVTAELDHGPIIAQAVVPILPNDSESALAARVLVEEHRLLPQAVSDFCVGKLVVEGLQVNVNR
jgi:phosphoribosylglycinamide formyltransferase 1